MMLVYVAREISVKSNGNRTFIFDCCSGDNGYSVLQGNLEDFKISLYMMKHFSTKNMTKCRQMLQLRATAVISSINSVVDNYSTNCCSSTMDMFSFCVPSTITCEMIPL